MPRKVSAFELIALAGGLDLSNLFADVSGLHEPAGLEASVRLPLPLTRFVTRLPAPHLLRRLQSAAQAMGYSLQVRKEKVRE